MAAKRTRCSSRQPGVSSVGTPVSESSRSTQLGPLEMLIAEQGTSHGREPPAGVAWCGMPNAERHKPTRTNVGQDEP
jgi:hypothetical protein